MQKGCHTFCYVTCLTLVWIYIYQLIRLQLWEENMLIKGFKDVTCTCLCNNPVLILEVSEKCTCNKKRN